MELNSLAIVTKQCFNFWNLALATVSSSNNTYWNQKPLCRNNGMIYYIWRAIHNYILFAVAMVKKTFQYPHMGEIMKTAFLRQWIYKPWLRVAIYLKALLNLLHYSYLADTGAESQQWVINKISCLHGNSFHNCLLIIL